MSQRAYSYYGYVNIYWHSFSYINNVLWILRCTCRILHPNIVKMSHYALTYAKVSCKNNKKNYLLLIVLFCMQVVATVVSDHISWCWLNRQSWCLIALTINPSISPCDSTDWVVKKCTERSGLSVTVYLLIYLFIYSYIYSFIYSSSIRSFFYSYIYLFVFYLFCLFYLFICQDATE